MLRNVALSHALHVCEWSMALGQSDVIRSWALLVSGSQETTQAGESNHAVMHVDTVPTGPKRWSRWYSTTIVEVDGTAARTPHKQLFRFWR